MRCTSAMCVGVTILGFSIATACIAEDTSNVLPRHREMRVWTNADGTKSVRASLVSIADGVAVFVRENGENASCTLERLSKADREVVEAATTTHLVATRSQDEANPNNTEQFLTETPAQKPHPQQQSVATTQPPTTTRCATHVPVRRSFGSRLFGRGNGNSNQSRYRAPVATTRATNNTQSRGWSNSRRGTSQGYRRPSGNDILEYDWFLYMLGEY